MSLALSGGVSRLCGRSYICFDQTPEDSFRSSSDLKSGSCDARPRPALPITHLASCSYGLIFPQGLTRRQPKEKIPIGEFGSQTSAIVIDVTLVWRRMKWSASYVVLGTSEERQGTDDQGLAFARWDPRGSPRPIEEEEGKQGRACPHLVREI